MKPFFLMLLSFFIFNACSLSKIKPAESALTPSDSLDSVSLSKIHSYLKVFPNNTEVAMAIIQGGKTSFYGVKRAEDLLITVDNSTSIFEIGSITKVFTSTLLAHQIVAGNIQLEDPINAHLPFSVKDDQLITFQQLANHTSGLPRMPADFRKVAGYDSKNPYQHYKDEHLANYIEKEVQFDNPPGQDYAYSNLGAGLLGYTLGQITQQPYEASLKQYIFDSLGMNNTFIGAEKAGDRLIPGLNAKGQEVPNWDLAALAGAGALLSNVEDLSKFAQAQLGTSNEVLALTRKKTFSAASKMDLGLGWHIIKTDDGNDWHWHNGGTGGYSSSMVIDLRKQQAIILLSNVSAFSPKTRNVENLGFDLMKNLD